MKITTTFAIALVLTLALAVPQLLARTFDVRFVVVPSDGPHFDVTVQIKANDESFRMGTSNFFFTFNQADLASPTLLTAARYNGGPYQPLTLATEQLVSINVELNEPGTGDIVPTSFTDIATIRFTIANPSGTADLRWVSSATVVFMNDETTIVPDNQLMDYTESIHPNGFTSVKETAPVVFALMQNNPNPFNPESEIKFSVEKSGRATLQVFNIAGQLVATLFDEVAEAGQYYHIRFGSSNLASGVYFYRLQSFNKTDVRKMLLVR